MFLAKIRLGHSFFYPGSKVGIMPTRPTTLISDEMIHLLESISLSKASFFELTGVQHPREIDPKSFDLIRKEISNIETELQNKYPFNIFLCMATGEALYWIDESKVESLQKEMLITIQDINKEGPLPVWKCTTAELLLGHLRNIKRLILAIAHDFVLLENLQNHLGDRYKLVYREFHQAELRILNLLEAVREHGTKITYALNQDLILLERCRITQSIIERGEKTPKELGYSLREISEAIEILNERCKKSLHNASTVIRLMHNFFMNALREGENSQLIRACRWEILYSMLDEAPDGMESFVRIMSLERNGMSVFVKSREQELGETAAGQQALSKAKESKKTIESIARTSALPPGANDKNQTIRRPHRIATIERHR